MEHRKKIKEQRLNKHQTGKNNRETAEKQGTDHNYFSYTLKLARVGKFYLPTIS